MSESPERVENHQVDLRFRKKSLFNPRFYLSDICRFLELSGEDDIQTALDRSFSACTGLNISANDHFREVYRDSAGQLTRDWILSQLGVYLFTIHSDPDNKKVARAQLFFVDIE